MHLALNLELYLLFVRTDGDDDDAKYDRRFAAAAADVDYAKYGGKKNYYAESPIWELSDLPLTLTAFGYLQNIVFSTIRKFRATNRKYSDIRCVENYLFIVHSRHFAVPTYVLIQIFLVWKISKGYGYLYQTTSVSV